MPQDRDTGAAGNDYGRDCGQLIANLLGAKKIRSGKASNECLLNGKRVVIKCTKSKRPQQIAVYALMFDRLDAVIGAFENADGSYHVYEISLEKFRKRMRFRKYPNGDRGLMKRDVFECVGDLLQIIPAE